MRNFNLLRLIFIWLVRGYRFFISPMLPPVCRFYPTCSHYMEDAIKKYGIIGGLYRGIGRLMRCHPLSAGGYDPLK